MTTRKSSCCCWIVIAAGAAAMMIFPHESDGFKTTAISMQQRQRQWQWQCTTAGTAATVVDRPRFVLSMTADDVVVLMTNQTSTTTKAAPASPVNNDDNNHNDGLTAQERVLRAAGLWDEQQAKKNSMSKEERRLKLEKQEEALQRERRNNIGVAIGSILLSCTNYAWQMAHPVTEVQLLANMQAHSAPLEMIGKNGKPSVVDFWAPWCENCKAAAPTMQTIEQEYGDRVNFVLVNGDEDAAWPLIEKFGVDAIPHMALVTAQGDVETALIGPIPRSILRQDLDVLLENGKNCKEDEKTGGVATVVLDEKFKLCDKAEELPHKMFDAFQNRPEERRISF